jgi:phytoene dehydrogenase-like protein
MGKLAADGTIKSLAGKQWDVIIVGAGHNGLTCAAYLARAGKRVLVIEARNRVGGACTIDEVWPGVRVSPCAYLVGLLHPLVIHELKMGDYGFRWAPASSGMFVPFDDGTSIQLWDDDSLCEAEVRRFAPSDLEGWRAFCAVKGRLRDALRPEGDRDIWVGRAPSRAQIKSRLGGDEEAIKLLFEWSMVECLEHYFRDERLQCAYLGQGVIGTNASPHDPGTASIHYHHQSGRLGGVPGLWGYVHGGIGMVSFILADIARDLGAAVLTGIPVAQILPGVGVEIDSGERIETSCVVSNADPRATLRMLGDCADAAWRARVESVPQVGCTVKLNVLLKELPSFTARRGTRMPHHLGQINTPLSKSEWRDYHRVALGGELPARLWTELYFQTAHDSSIAREGVQTMSVFAQYVPHTFANGTWDSRRDEVKNLALNSIARYCDNIPSAVIDAQVLGPPDIEREVGLTGGQIFQGECLPPYMWDRRLEPRTPMPGLFLCGAATYPGGSVMGINGRNAAMEILGEG